MFLFRTMYQCFYFICISSSNEDGDTNRNLVSGELSDTISTIRFSNITDLHSSRPSLVLVNLRPTNFGNGYNEAVVDETETQERARPISPRSAIVNRVVDQPSEVNATIPENGNLENGSELPYILPPSYENVVGSHMAGPPPAYNRYDTASQPLVQTRCVQEYTGTRVREEVNITSTSQSNLSNNLKTKMLKYCHRCLLHPGIGMCVSVLPCAIIFFLIWQLSNLKL